MYHPTTRLLTILELLQTRGQMSSTEIAARLEVNTRTVRRYILMLQDIGIPIESEMGQYGGYSLQRGFRLPPMMFTNDEALALVLGLLVVRHLGLSSSGASVEGAMAKLQRVLPHALHEQSQAMQAALTIDLPIPEQRIPHPILATLSQAVHEKQQVRINYRKDSSDSERTVNPYGLVFHDQVWYLVGYCHLRTTIRVFRLDRITQVTVQPDTFTAPLNFDSLAYLLNSFAIIPDRWNVEVILKTSLDQAVTTLLPGMAVLEQHSQGVLLRTSIPDLAWMARYLVGHGFPLIICQPPELRTAFETLAHELLNIAASGDHTAEPK